LLKQVAQRLFAAKVLIGRLQAACAIPRSAQTKEFAVNIEAMYPPLQAQVVEVSLEAFG
jgi:hypothetical protein